MHTEENRILGNIITDADGVSMEYIADNTWMVVGTKQHIQEKRKQLYPNIADQMDMLWHMMDDDVIPGKAGDWYNTILNVKMTQPYPAGSLWNEDTLAWDEVVDPTE